MRGWTLSFAALMTDAGGFPDATPATGPLWAGQEAIWLSSQLDPTSGWNSVTYRLEMERPIRMETVQAALDHLVSRHHTLRTRYVQRDGWLTQEISEPYSVQTRLCDFGTRPDTDASFSPTLDPPSTLRAVIEIENDGARACSLLAHHVAVDATSMVILAGDFASHCAGEVRPAVADTYIDWVLRARQACAGEKALRLHHYWAMQLQNSPPPTEWTPATGAPHFSRREVIPLPSEITASLREVSRSYEVSLFTLLLAGCYKFLCRISSAPSFVFVIPVSLRDEPAARSVGYFVNMIPLILQDIPSTTTRELCVGIAAKLQVAREHRYFPFQAIVQLAKPERRPGRPPLGQVMVNLTKCEDVAFGNNQITVDRIVSQGSAYDVSIDFILKNGELTGVFRVPDRMSAVVGSDALAANFLDALVAIIHGAASTPSASVFQKPSGSWV